MSDHLVVIKVSISFGIDVNLIVTPKRFEVLV